MHYVVASSASMRSTRSGTTDSGRSRRHEADQHPDDLKGFKIRVPVSPQWTSLFKSRSGVSHLHQFQRGVLRALQTRSSTVRRTRSSSSRSRKLCEVQKATSRSPITWDGFFPDQRARLGRAAGAVAGRRRQEHQCRGREGREDLETQHEVPRDSSRRPAWSSTRTDPAPVPCQSAVKSGYYKGMEEHLRRKRGPAREKPRPARPILDRHRNVTPPAPPHARHGGPGGRREGDPPTASMTTLPPPHALPSSPVPRKASAPPSPTGSPRTASTSSSATSTTLRRRRRSTNSGRRPPWHRACIST